MLFSSAEIKAAASDLESGNYELVIPNSTINRESLTAIASLIWAARLKKVGVAFLHGREFSVSRLENTFLKTWGLSLLVHQAQVAHQSEFLLMHSRGLRGGAPHSRSELGVLVIL